MANLGVLRCFLQEMWLSTQFIDHILLILVGLPYSILQPMLACIHIELREKGIDARQLDETEPSENKGNNREQ